jgi:hypothetical protein
MSNKDTLTRWFATLASALVAAAIIGMATLTIQMAIKVAQLETRLQALQAMHAAHEADDG